MYIWICMHDYFDLITNPFDYKYENFEVFIRIHFKKMWWM